MKDKLDRLGEAFLLAEPGDLPAMKELRARLDELRPEAGPAAEAAAALGRIMDLLIEGRLDPALGWEAVEKALQAFQDKVRAAGDFEDTPTTDRAPLIVLESPAPSPFPVELDADLLGGFILEAREHLDAADARLLALASDASDLEALHTVFRAFHTIKGGASCLDLGGMEALAHETENLLDLARKGVVPMAEAVLDVVFEAVDAMKRLTADAEARVTTGQVRPPDPALDGLISRIRGTVAAKGRALPETAPASAARETSRISDSGTAVKESVRVDADRLDRLADLIGELVIAESMVSQSPELRRLALGGVLSESVGQLDKITRELQEMGMSLRMMPVRPLFRKTARLARDLSRKLGKPIEFSTSGEEIEIDRAIANCVTDGLVHIIRNALDHGIEASTEERIRAGKTAAGRIELRASHREGCILIEVEDDGRGLDADAILRQGIAKGLVRSGEGLAEQDIFQLIFLPGFSTAKEVTELSGRGVGLDVARTSVEALRGRIEVQSKRGRGTVLRLRLPLTLAIIDGMVIRAGRERFVVPTLSITRLVRPEPAQMASFLDREEMLSLQDELVPLFRLGRLLDTSGAPEEGPGVAVVVEDAGRRAALLADEVLGQQQIVIKSLGMDLERVPGISGGVILPDGQVGLILDVGGLLARRAATAPAGSAR